MALKRLWAPWRLEYVQHADDQDGCFFCDAAGSDDDEGHLVVHRGERVFVLLNKFPYASGHLLVAPFRHGHDFDDIVDASERIWDLLDNYKEIVEALEDTNESLISHQQNDILYVLTIFSVVMLPLTFLTGFFGMNVRFPGFDSNVGFFATLGLFLLTLGGMLGFFRWKKWL